MSMPREAKQEVERFLRDGKKIGAVKYLKDTYGFSLTQSRILVEAVEKNFGVRHEDFPEASAHADADEQLKEQVKALLASGKKIEAVKMVKDTLRMRLHGAKLWVEDIAREGRPRRTFAARRVHAGSGGILLGAFIGLGLLFFAAATYVYYQQSHSIQQSDLIKGKVVRLQYNGDDMSAPIIEYEWHGQKWLYASSTYSSPPAFAVDEEVPVYVNRQDPKDVIVDTFSQRWLAILILATLGTFFVGLPLLIVHVTSRQ